jgi:dTDP-6-deoxy-L-talose 4-dehydrogenase (NAD+)
MAPGTGGLFPAFGLDAEPEVLGIEREYRLALGSLSLVRDLIANGVGHFVMAGTCLEYDIRRGWLAEDAPTRPETLYAKAKLAVSDLARSSRSAAEPKLRWRIFHLYGPGEDDRLGGPKRRRSGWRPASDSRPRPAIRFATFRMLRMSRVAFATIVERRGEGVFNLASGEPISLRSLVGKIGEFWGERN